MTLQKLLLKLSKNKNIYVTLLIPMENRAILEIEESYSYKELYKKDIDLNKQIEQTLIKDLELYL